MKSIYRFTRSKCQQHEWLGNLFMLTGSLFFAATIVVFILFQQEILGWVHKNPLLNPMLLGIAVVAEVAMFFVISRLVFTDCTVEAEQHEGIYVSRKSAPVSGNLIHSMALNPKRRKS